MTGVLEEYPLDFSRPELRAIRDVLARVFYQPRELEDLVLAVGLNPGQIDFGGNAVLQWRSILAEARAEERLSALLSVVREMRPPIGPRLDELLSSRPVLEPGTGQLDDLSGHGVGWKGFGGERLIMAGNDTLLGIAFLGTGVDRSRSICRVTATFGPERAAHGTAALIGPDLLLTNHHVLHDWDRGGAAAVSVEAWFGYELDEAGQERQRSVVPCATETITGERDHDWAVVRTAMAPPGDSFVLSLRGGAAPRPGDYVFIIQHPEGGPKMIALSHNLVRHVDSNVLQYWADTKAGSSGAPVFNRRWEVVGLHHRWVEAPDGDGVAYRNQGQRIERVLEDLERHGLGVT
jgi:V8-like Glu-specific endopeptidase